MQIARFKELQERYPNVEWEMYAFPAVQDGWAPLLEKLVEDLSTLLGHKRIVITKTKEKRGQLRFHADIPESIKEEALELIYSAEKQSKKICEFCGSPGTIQPYKKDGYTGGWSKCICHNCNTTPKNKVLNNEKE